MSEIRVLENERLKVCVSDHGAELISIYDKKREREMVWNADPAYWNRHAPVLFPFVGKVTDGFYMHQGKKYPMGQHGFARDCEFVHVETTEHAIVHRLESNEEIKEKYPFDFVLEIVHRLNENCVTVEWKVYNPAKETLYFSIGGHPAFCVKEHTGSRLVFEGRDTLRCVYIDPATGGVDVEHPEELPLKNGVYVVKPDTFDRDALIFDEGQVKSVRLEDADGTKLVTMQCPDALSVGIWSPVKKIAPFICLEPWIGRCDNSGFRGELKDKYGEQALGAGETFETAYKLLIEE